MKAPLGRPIAAGPADVAQHDATERMCPSTPVANATVFLGMVTPSRRIAYVTPAIAATPELLAALPTGTSNRENSAGLESEYRFAGPCVTQQCGFWNGRQCGLGERLSESLRHAESVLATDSAEPAGGMDGVTRTKIPKCAIRPTCRWFAEQGPDVCRACTFVVTDSRALENSASRNQGAP